MNGQHATPRPAQRRQTTRARRWHPSLLAFVAAAVAMVIGSGIYLAVSEAGSAGVAATPPPAASDGVVRLHGTGTAVPARVCGNPAVLGAGPRSAPAGSIVVPAGTDSGVDFGRAGATYWFAPGRHALGSGTYTQIVPGAGSVFIGAPGAVLDGGHVNDYAFGGYATDVTIEYLTVENFGTVGGNQNQGVVNNDSSSGWTITHSAITGNAGAGVMLGSHDTLRYDCLADNQQYGFNAYSASGVTGLNLDHNEITRNDSYNYEAKDPGCGCSGGGKFWDVDGAAVLDNWIHDNGDVGLWADTNNRGFDITGNYISDNSSYGLIYEISYNALISRNTFVRNGLTEGPQNPSFPTSAIYISESGGDSRVPGAYSGTLSITDNAFSDNWSGVVLWENSNRFCGSPANTSTSACTLVSPSATVSSCGSARLIRLAPYRSDCRWETKNVLVAGNVFAFSQAGVGPRCTPSNGCGLQGLFSEYGTYPSWSPYQGTLVEQHITYDQHNRFAANSYIGPWEFMAYQQGNIAGWLKWTTGSYRQDQGSSLRLSPAP